MENTENKVNVTDITVIDESERKSVFVVNKESVSTKSADMNDLGIQTALIVTNESNLTESIIMSNAEAQSTPVLVKENNKTDDEMRNWFCEIMGEIKLMSNVLRGEIK